MSGTTQASLIELQNGANHVREVRDELVNMLNALQSAVQAAAPAFVGQGGTAFQNVMIRWSDETNALNDALSRIADGIESAGRNFGQTDQQIMESINRAAAATGGAEGISLDMSVLRGGA